MAFQNKLKNALNMTVLGSLEIIRSWKNILKRHKLSKWIINSIHV
jgi:hypothetical protein